MSTLRRLAVTGAFAVPLSLLLAGTSGADIGDGPFGPAATVHSSTTYAGIGGAGTIHEAMGSGYHGSWWSEQSASTAGPGGAVVQHHAATGTNHHHGSWTNDTESDDSVHDNDSDDRVSTVASHPVRQHTRHVAQRPHEYTTTTYTRHRDQDASYVDKTLTADVDGATSSTVASHAGDDYAVYHSADLAAGPGGASSQGVHAVAVPEYAGYKSWYAAADVTGATVHEVSAVADATDDDTYDNRPGHDEDDDD